MTADVHPLSASIRGGETGSNYEILGKLATGGMAELFLARTPSPSGRPGPVVVLKRILPHLAEDPEFIRMFRDEAYLAATLRHPNIVQVFDIGKRGEDYFFTMEYVHGENLRAILRSAQKRGESIPLTHILTIGLGITAALHHAHEQTDDQGRPLHIVHRDVSPTNVLVAYDGSVKIVDFGIAKAAAGTHVTQAGMLKGKASYMSPEQCRASTVDRRSDVFAIGILLYEMTTLTRLFKGENELAILHQVLSGSADPPSTRRPGFPPELERIIMKTLATEPGDRYPTAEALQADLMRFGQQNNMRPSNPALGQFLRGLFGNRPLPWDDAQPAQPPGAAQPGSGANVVEARPRPSPPQPRSPRPQPPQGQRQPPQPPGRPVSAASRPARGPGSRAPAAKPWRPGGRKTPPPPPAGATVPKPPGPSGGVSTAKQVRLDQQRPHGSSRATAPRSAAIPRPPARPVRTPGRGGGKPATPKPRPSAAAYAPPPPDYDLDPEESKTAIAAPRYEDAKTRVSGATADDVAAFIAAAPAAQLGSQRSEDLATQVAPPKNEDAVTAFLAAAPPAQLADDKPSPLVSKTQVAPATAAELAALADIEPSAELFATPMAPTSPGGRGRTVPPSSSMTQPMRPKASDLPPPGGSARPPMPSPSSLPPPGGHPAAPRQEVPPNRRDTIMNAPAQPAALGGPSRTLPQPPTPDDGLDDLATQRMTVDQMPDDSGRTVVPPGGSGPAVMARPAPPASSHPGHGPGAHPGHPGPVGHPQAPMQQWQNAGLPQAPGNYTVPMPMSDLGDDPIVVPGRNSKMIAMVITVVVGLGVGAAGVWAFLL